MRALSTPLRTIRLPITCCPECRRSFDIGQWDELAHVKVPDNDARATQYTMEWRRCPCGQTLGLDSSARTLDAFVPEEWYRTLFPNSSRRAVSIGKPRAVGSMLRWLADRLGG